MADSQVKLKFFADAEAAEKAIVQLEKKYTDLENKVKQVGRRTKESFDEGGLTLGKLAAAFGPAVAGLLSIETAVQAVSHAYRIWKDDIQQAADEHQKFVRQLMTSLALTGDLASGKQVKAALQNVPGVLEGQAAAAFGGVRGAAPTMPLGRVLEITQAISALGPVLAPLDAQGKLTDTTKLSALGDVAGTLAQIMPQTSAGDIGDLSLAVQGAAGDRVGQLRSAGFEKALRSMTEAGISPERALATAVNALDVGADPAALALATTKLDAGKGITFEKLLGDDALAKKVLGTRAFAGFGLLDQQAIGGLEAGFRAAQQGDLLERTIRDAAALDPETFARQGVFALDEKSDRPFGEFQSQRDTRRQAAFEEAPGWAKPFIAPFMASQAAFETAKLGVQGERAFESGGYQRPEQGVEQIMGRVSASVDELVRITKEQKDILNANKPAVQRNAHVE
ncbi:MAG: hypothetical protein IPM64_17975 [Phycisphaerales bacterium]|nr:hypothetical protein [Phycisphaerales bacterium]